MNLYYRSYGELGPPLVILHGLLGTADNWHQLAQRFGNYFTVLVPDLRNHGQSPHNDEINYPLMASDVCELLDSLNIESVIMLGHSMGGKVAMHLALNHPERVSRLVVVDIKPGEYRRGHDQIFKALLSMPVQLLETRKEAEEWLIENGIENFAERQFLLKNLTRNDNGDFAWKPNLQALWNHYDEIRSGVSGIPFAGPALFVKGAKSAYLNAKTDFESLFPAATLISIAEAGHWVHAEQPQAFLEEVLNWLNARQSH